MRMVHNKTFKRFMVSYILILLIPLSITAYFYTKSTTIMEQNAIEANVFKLNNFRDVMDNKIEQIDKYILELNHSEKLSLVAQLPNPVRNTPDMYWYYDFKSFFDNFSYDSTDQDQCFLFLNRNDVVYGDYYLNFSRKAFYEDHFKYGGYSYEDWEELFFGKRHYARFLPAEDITILDKTSLYIPYLNSLPLISSADENDTGKIRGTIVYLLNVDGVHDLITNSLSESGGETYILGDNMQILASTESRQSGLLDIGSDMTGDEGVRQVSWNGRETVAIHVSSSISGLSYMTLLPVDEIRSNMYRLQVIVLVFLAAALLVGLLVSMLFSYRNTLPIVRLLSAYSDLETRLETQRKSIEILTIDKLLKNDFDSVSDLDLNLKRVSLEFGNNLYRVILVRILSGADIISDTILQEQDLYRATLDALLRPQDVLHNLSHNELAIIAAFQREDEIEDMIRRIQGEFKRRYGFVPLFAVGGAYGSPLDIHRSLREAQMAADYVEPLKTAGHVIWYRDIPTGNIFDLFGKEQEQILSNLIRQGNTDALKAHLNQLNASTEYRTMPVRMKQLYLAYLHVILLRLSGDSKTPLAFQLLEQMSAGKHKSYFNAIKEAFLDLCSQLNRSKKSHNQNLCESILEYLNTHYRNSDLSVTALASRFNMAESYFSQFFREQTGEPFSRYLEKLRINHACELLPSSTMTIEQIACYSGYNSANTFRRAFKRITGVSPSDYSRI